jgi:hypothetical protein
MTSDFISLIANLALTLSFIVGLIFGIAQVRAAARDRRERLTIEALRGFQSREFAELLQFVVVNEMPASRRELAALPTRDQVLYLQVAQSMEMLGILVADRYLDVDLVDKTLGSFVVTSWEKFKKLAADVRPSDPYLNEYWQWLAERVLERMTQHPRRPFYEQGSR